MATNNKLIYSYNHGTKAIAPETLSSYSDSFIVDEAKRTLWYRGHQYGNSYYGSAYGENFNDFLHNNASGNFSHAEGSYTSATGSFSHAEGLATKAEGDASVSSGSYTVASAFGAHAEGYGTEATGGISHAEGDGVKAIGEGSHAEGQYTISDGNYSHAEGNKTTSEGIASHAEGFTTTSAGDRSHAEGQYTTAYSSASHAEGTSTSTFGVASHAEGNSTKAFGETSHAEGNYTIANGQSSHSEGQQTISYGTASHAEGKNTKSYGVASHAEGLYSYAIGEGSHATGIFSYAYGKGSFTTGIGTQSYNTGESAFGSYNASSDKTIFTIGDGLSNDERHNIIEIQKDVTYISSPTYFGDQVVAPVTYSYIDVYGPEVTLQDLLVAAENNHKPRYTKPVIYAKFTANGKDITDYQASYITGSDAAAYVTMEVGSTFKSGVKVFWPTTENVDGIGTRSSYNPISDYLTVPPAYLGYSYGLQNITWPIQYDYAWAQDSNYRYDEPNATAYGNDVEGNNIQATGYTSLSEIGDYLVINNIQLSYKESSYQVSPGLWERGKIVYNYGKGDNTYFNASVANVPQKLYVRSRYAWYAGFTQNVPNSFDEIRYYSNNLKKGYLNEDITSIKNELVYNVSKADSKSNVFFIAVPVNYSIVSTDDGMIILEQKDGLEFDLITDIQRLNIRTMQVPSGVTQITYRVYYIEFKQSPLGIYGSQIKATFIGGAAPEQNGYLITEWGWPIGTEDGQSIQVDVYGETPVPPSNPQIMNDESGNAMTDESESNYINFDNI